MYHRGRHDSVFLFHFAPSPLHLPLAASLSGNCSLLKAGWSVCSPYYKQVGEGFAILGGNCLLQVSGVTRGSLPSNPTSWQLSPPTNLLCHGIQALLTLFHCSKSLDNQVVTVFDSCQNRMTLCQKPLRCRHFSCQQPVWVQFDRFDDSFHRVTDKCQTGRKLPPLKRSLRAANPNVTNEEILWIFGKKSL